MLTARNDLVAHLTASGLGFGQVEPYAGQMRGLAGDPDALTAVLPAAYVIAAGGSSKAPARPRRLIHVLIAGQTSALDAQAGAADALGLAEQLEAFVRGVHAWAVDGRRYVNLAADGIESETLAVTPSVSIVRVTWTVESR